MVDMNSDHIYEVPDTPDRIQQSTCLVSNPAARRSITNAARNPLPPRRIIFKTRNNSIQGQSSRGNASSVLPAPLDADIIIRQAELARLLPVAEDLEEKLSSRKSHRTTGTFVEDVKGAENFGLDQSSSISNHISYRGTEGRSYQIRGGEVSQQDASRRNADILGVGLGLPTIPVGKPRSRMGARTSNRLKEVVGADVCSGSRPRQDKGEAITNKDTMGLSSPTPCVVPQRRVGQRKLVRNGCISPSNISDRSVKVDENQEMCSKSGILHHPNPQVDVLEKGNVIDLTDNSPTITKQGKTVNDGLILMNKSCTVVFVGLW